MTEGLEDVCHTLAETSDIFTQLQGKLSFLCCYNGRYILCIISVGYTVCMYVPKYPLLLGMLRQGERE